MTRRTAVRVAPRHLAGDHAAEAPPDQGRPARRPRRPAPAPARRAARRRGGGPRCSCRSPSRGRRGPAPAGRRAAAPRSLGGLPARDVDHQRGRRRGAPRAAGAAPPPAGPRRGPRPARPARRRAEGGPAGAASRAACGPLPGAGPEPGRGQRGAARAGRGSASWHDYVRRLRGRRPRPRRRAPRAGGRARRSRPPRTRGRRPRTTASRRSCGTSEIAEPPKPPPVIRAPSAPAWTAVADDGVELGAGDLEVVAHRGVRVAEQPADAGPVAARRAPSTVSVTRWISVTTWVARRRTRSSSSGLDGRRSACRSEGTPSAAAAPRSRPRRSP